MDLAPDFDEFIASLTAHGVEFVIVGAYALAFHGAPRFTGAPDILVRPTVENGSRLLAALESFGFPVLELTPAAVADRRRMLQMGVPPVQIHVMSAISGVEWEEVWTNRVAGTLGHRVVAFLGRETLLRNKRAAGRPKDLADIDALEEDNGESCHGVGGLTTVSAVINAVRFRRLNDPIRPVAEDAPRPLAIDTGRADGHRCP
jgi:hypothetical protein